MPSTRPPHLDRRRREPRQTTNSDDDDRSLWVLLEGVPSTLLPSDVLRLLDGRGSSATPGGERTNISKLVTEARPVYLSASMSPSHQYIFKVSDRRYRDTIKMQLQGKLIAGQAVRAKFITSETARYLSSFRIWDISTSIPSNERIPYPEEVRGEKRIENWLPPQQQFGEFVKAIVSQTPGRVVLLRGLPSNMSADTLKRRLSRKYALATSRVSRLRWWDDRNQKWTHHQIEPVLKLHTAVNRDTFTQGRREGSIVFLIRLANGVDAQRLYRRFHKQTWNPKNRSFQNSSHIRRLVEYRMRKESYLERNNSEDPDKSQGEEMNEIDEDLEDDLEETDEMVDPQVRRQEAERFENEEAARGMGQVISRPERGEVRSEERKFIVEAQIMY
ncbi:unnamed protein product [Sympodiomycopsis kandeliae]